MKKIVLLAALTLLGLMLGRSPSATAKEGMVELPFFTYGTKGEREGSITVGITLIGSPAALSTIEAHIGRVREIAFFAVVDAYLSNRSGTLGPVDVTLLKERLALELQNAFPEAESLDVYFREFSSR